MSRQDVISLWTVHRDTEWPISAGSREGELMTLDTVISGCVTFYLDERTLDEPRVAMLESCLADLDEVLRDLDTEVRPYFDRLTELGRLLLAEHYGGSRPR